MNHCNFSEPITTYSFPTPPREKFIANDDFVALMERGNVTTFESIWSFSGGKIIKEIRERSVLRCQFPLKSQQGAVTNADENTLPCFIKKHTQRLSLFKRLFALFHPDSFLGEGMKEFHFYCKFRENGLATPVPIAAGMRYTSFFQVESFLITRDFSPFIDLEELVLNKPETFQGETNQDRKKCLLSSIADYARRMHQAGLNQKDFNATHVLLDNIDNGQPQVALFDLQRVDTNPLNNYLWTVKALSELFYTLPESLFKEDDKLFLFKKYKNKQELSVLDQLQYSFIKRKTEKIANHSRKHGLAPKMPTENS